MLTFGEALFKAEGLTLTGLIGSAFESNHSGLFNFVINHVGIYSGWIFTRLRQVIGEDFEPYCSTLYNDIREIPRVSWMKLDMLVQAFLKLYSGEVRFRMAVGSKVTRTPEELSIGFTNTLAEIIAGYPGRDFSRIFTYFLRQEYFDIDFEQVQRRLIQLSNAQYMGIYAHEL